MSKATFERTFPFSNFDFVDIEHGGIVYPSVENFYQAMKTGREELYPSYVNIRPAEAKRLSKKNPVRPDWRELKDKVMWTGLRKKFAPGSRFAQTLLAYDQEIIETNYWHDNYWGSCTCPRCGNTGQNKLGKMLMKIREELRSQASVEQTLKKRERKVQTKRSTGMVDKFVANIHRGDAYDVYIGRAGKGQKGEWGNPFIVGKDGTPVEVVQKYEAYLHWERPDLLKRAKQELKGKVLGCFCKGKHPVCHGHVLAWYANEEELVNAT